MSEAISRCLKYRKSLSLKSNEIKVDLLLLSHLILDNWHGIYIKVLRIKALFANNTHLKQRGAFTHIKGGREQVSSLTAQYSTAAEREQKLLLPGIFCLGLGLCLANKQQII